MPSRPLRACPRCRQAVEALAPCPSCSAAYVDRTRNERTVGYGTKGHRYGFRLAVLDRDPLCVICCSAVATVADHYPSTRRELIAAGADPDDPAYGRGLCAPCHSRATALDPRTVGGWNKVRG